jgi:hypothetical protein
LEVAVSLFLGFWRFKCFVAFAFNRRLSLSKLIPWFLFYFAGISMCLRPLAPTIDRQSIESNLLEQQFSDRSIEPHDTFSNLGFPFRFATWFQVRKLDRSRIEAALVTLADSTANRRRTKADKKPSKEFGRPTGVRFHNCQPFSAGDPACFKATAIAREEVATRLTTRSATEERLCQQRTSQSDSVVEREEVERANRLRHCDTWTSSAPPTLKLNIFLAWHPPSHAFIGTAAIIISSIIFTVSITVAL